jgi:ComF family protein
MFDAVVRRGSRAVLDLLAPRRCAGCDTDLQGADLFCAVCEATVSGEYDASPLVDGTRVVAVGAYGGALAQAVRRLKYEGRTDLAAPLARRLKDRIVAAGLSSATLVPVPLHAKKLAERGYNQSALVARPLARELRARSSPRGLVRFRHTAPQAELGRNERLENVRGAVVARERFDGRCVVLIDDVVTTGATALACVEALRAAGATVAGVGAIARASFFASRSS